jgi:hypothetical protein
LSATLDTTLPITPEAISAWLAARVSRNQRGRAAYRSNMRRLRGVLARSVNFFLPACPELTRPLPAGFWR